MKRILVIGSMNMDFVTSLSHMPVVGETVLAQGLEFIPGGKGANQAFAMGRLGGSVTMLGSVGADTYGEKLCENLAYAGVDVSHVLRSAHASTSMAVIGVTPQGDNSIIVLPGANGCVDPAYLQENHRLLEECDLVVMQLEIPLETVVYAAQEAKRLGKTVVLDPAPAVPDLPVELYPCLDLIKPNETELSILVGRPYTSETLRECAGLLQEKGVKNVLVTLGGEGSYLLKEDGTEMRLPAKPVKVVDTTAAGDSYLAGLCVGLSQGQSLEEAVELAGEVANIVVTRRGAQTSIPTLEEVQEARKGSQLSKESKPC
ncbi:MAG: ribokinase [Acutalibacter sp.]